MQLYKMPASGGEAIQMTFDTWQNWFPHESPDGKWLAFLSYPSTIPSGSHPANFPVMIRLMSTEDGNLRVLAHLYGGQGTINVQSWSPDSQQLAFVSYTAEF
jgi:Tol biopolymer transport system component